MKRSLIYELRMYLATLLLGWAWDISPNDKEGKDLKIKLAEYFSGAVEKQENVPHRYMDDKGTKYY